MSNISTRYRVSTPVLAMRAAASDRAECTSECLFGEIVTRVLSPSTQTIANETIIPIELPTGELPTGAIDRIDDPLWLHVTLARDKYTGFVKKAHLTHSDLDLTTATHRVRTSGTLVFEEPSIKSRVLERLPFLSHIISSAPCNENFYSLATGGYVWRQHVSDIDESLENSALEIAHSHFLGTPYLWGGCTPQGVDCSGLVQALAIAKGLSMPRDSADQEQTLPGCIEYEHRQTQDLVYWPGHTGILVDRDTLLHATAHTLNCIAEPLSDVINRAGRITSIKRIFD